MSTQEDISLSEKLYDVADAVHSNGLGFQPLSKNTPLEFVIAYVPEDCDLEILSKQAGCTSLRIVDTIGRDFLVIGKDEFHRRFIVLDALANLEIPAIIWFLQMQIPVEDVKRPITEQAVEECVYSCITTGKPTNVQSHHDDAYAKNLRLYFQGRGAAVSHLFHPFVYRHWDKFTIPKTMPSEEAVKEQASCNFRTFSKYLEVANFFETLA